MLEEVWYNNNGARVKANALGYGISKKAAQMKTNQILSMNRAEKKNYLTECIYKNSRANANANLHTFMDNPFGTVEQHFARYRYGVYSSISSALSLVAYGEIS